MLLSGILIIFFMILSILGYVVELSKESKISWANLYGLGMCILTIMYVSLTIGD